MEVLRKLFEQRFRVPVERVDPLQGQLGGSGRKIVRLTSDKLTAIGIFYDVREENIAFLEFSRHFRRHGLPVRPRRGAVGVRALGGPPANGFSRPQSGSKRRP